MSTYLGVLRL